MASLDQKRCWDYGPLDKLHPLRRVEDAVAASFVCRTADIDRRNRSDFTLRTSVQDQVTAPALIQYLSANPTRQPNLRLRRVGMAGVVMQQSRKIRLKKAGGWGGKAIAYTMIR